LDLFENENEVLIRDYVIKNYIENMNDSALEIKIKYMLKYYNKLHFKKFEINKGFPKKKIIEIFKPYLYLFYMGIFSLDINKRNKSNDLWEKCMFRFRYFFPTFGKKYIKLNNEPYDVGFSTLFQIPPTPYLIVNPCSTKQKRERLKRRKQRQERKQRQQKQRKQVKNENDSNTIVPPFVYPYTEEYMTTYFSSFCKKPTKEFGFYFDDKHPTFFSKERNDHFIESHLGKAKTNLSTENEDYAIPLYEFEKDRMINKKRRGFSFHPENEMDEFIENIDIYLLL